MLLLNFCYKVIFTIIQMVRRSRKRIEPSQNHQTIKREKKLGQTWGIHRDWFSSGGNLPAVAIFLLSLLLIITSGVCFFIQMRGYLS